MPSMRELAHICGASLRISAARACAYLRRDLAHICGATLRISAALWWLAGNYVFGARL